MKEISLALIGLGTLAEQVHLKRLQRIEGVKIKAICDINEARVREIQAQYQIEKAYLDPEKMFQELSLDGVIISTPNSSHIPLAELAVKYGVHMFIEKPIGTQLSQVKAFVEKVEEEKLIAMVGMPFRFRKDVEIAKEYLEQKKFGQIYYTKASLKRKRGTPSGWFTNKKLAGGGSLMDLGVHMLDLAWDVLGKPQVKSVSGHTVTALGNYETRYLSSWQSANKGMNTAKVFDVDDFSSAWIRLEHDSVLSLEVSWALNGEEEDYNLQVYGTKGGLNLNPLTIYEEDDGIFMKKTPSFIEGDMFQEELKHFLQCIRYKKQPLIDAREGYEILKILQAIYQASKEQREISYDS